MSKANWFASRHFVLSQWIRHVRKNADVVYMICQPRDCYDQDRPFSTVRTQGYCINTTSLHLTPAHYIHIHSHSPSSFTHPNQSTIQFFPTPPSTMSFFEKQMKKGLLKEAEKVWDQNKAKFGVNSKQPGGHGAPGSAAAPGGYPAPPPPTAPYPSDQMHQPYPTASHVPPPPTAPYPSNQMHQPYPTGSHVPPPPQDPYPTDPQGYNPYPTSTYGQQAGANGGHGQQPYPSGASSQQYHASGAAPHHHTGADGMPQSGPGAYQKPHGGYSSNAGTASGGGMGGKMGKFMAKLEEKARDPALQAKAEKLLRSKAKNSMYKH
ncbi:unnamed protein product [Chondrus crispus]|uniref:Uncharacterized protein n=1 Tax=Chondrus crispus TaxID=2769 RepID=R7Q654_CHOCR|nr:unnamed protein product [Chondrus crispus]CDF32876.1 unnamed protein product [Chondrus crispus]|eukprot:XP_005712677.1 unnamed protein product [Chondrus crispus]